ncbi:uncharacterized protein AMSG_11168 [Thecamonas trahens ATCC 50062]|uniref:DUF4394 domain-containing protein n=1 Tax=Thecamonas trahens ATCC 50062 TaxID=461836 RepID=A0A0L0DTX7_THETB|nr:hypothetical protein AMSG_11168 [Thecamonas trahens ATCC 50062]KNC55710.1 hypothetical protein AMSG_11168 [Thecamonas trahens ATCC 50062]|eukprot:XP_013752921.1 hypothetical protein AMSG_11168 [Thecamonas trahens ATCC 50062]
MTSCMASLALIVLLALVAAAAAAPGPSRVVSLLQLAKGGNATFGNAAVAIDIASGTVEVLANVPGFGGTGMLCGGADAASTFVCGLGSGGVINLETGEVTVPAMVTPPGVQLDGVVAIPGTDEFIGVDLNTGRVWRLTTDPTFGVVFTPTKCDQGLFDEGFAITADGAFYLYSTGAQLAWCNLTTNTMTTSDVKAGLFHGIVSLEGEMYAISRGFDGAAPIVYTFQQDVGYASGTWTPGARVADLGPSGKFAGYNFVSSFFSANSGTPSAGPVLGGLFVGKTASPVDARFDTLLIFDAATGATVATIDVADAFGDGIGLGIATTSMFV